MILLKNRKEIAFPIGVCSKIILKNRKILSKPIKTWAGNGQNSDSFLQIHNGWEVCQILGKNYTSKFCEKISCLLSIFWYTCPCLFPCSYSPSYMSPLGSVALPLPCRSSLAFLSPSYSCKSISDWESNQNNCDNCTSQ